MKLQDLWSRFQALSDENKKKVLWASVSVSGLIVIFILWGAIAAVYDRESDIKRLMTELHQIDNLAVQYNQVKANQQAKEARIRSNKVALFTLLQNSATRLDLKLNDLNERKEPFADSNWVRVSVIVTLKELSMDRLTAFLEDIEKSSENGLVKITRLQVKTRFDAPDLLDVQMTVSTWKANT